MPTENEHEDEDGLIPDYIPLTDDERSHVEQLEDGILLTLDEQMTLLTVIEKLVAHIDKQDKQITDLVMRLATK